MNEKSDLKPRSVRLISPYFASDLDHKLRRSNEEREDLEREVEGLRDEIAAVRNGGADGLSMAASTSGVSTNGSEDGSSSYAAAAAAGPGGERRIKELEEAVRTKNKQIHRLLEDVEQASRLYSLLGNQVS